LWPFNKKQEVEQENNDSPYIKLLQQRKKLEQKKPDKPANIYDIASNTLTLAVGITVLALGSAVTFGAPAIAIGLGGGSYAIYQEYKRRKFNKEIKKLDKEILAMENDPNISIPQIERSIGHDIKREIENISHKKRRNSNFLEMAFGAYGTASNTAQIAITGTLGVAGALLPYASLGIAAVGLGVFAYAEVKRRQEVKKNKNRDANTEIEAIELQEMGKSKEQEKQVSNNINIAIPEQQKPKKSFVASLGERTINVIKPKKKESYTQMINDEIPLGNELGKK
jgi:hypothetical protein